MVSRRADPHSQVVLRAPRAHDCRAVAGPNEGDNFAAVLVHLVPFAFMGLFGRQHLLPWRAEFSICHAMYGLVCAFDLCWDLNNTKASLSRERTD